MGPTKTMNAPGRIPRPRRPLEREQIIADALVDFASELRLTDAAELMSMIQNDHAANIADLVNSSTELFFKSGTLRYALSASFKAPWDATPTVEIDMEFRHAAVCAFFRLNIGQRRAGVEILDILFEERGWTISPKPSASPRALETARCEASSSPPLPGKPRASPVAQDRSGPCSEMAPNCHRSISSKSARRRRNGCPRAKRRSPPMSRTPVRQAIARSTSSHSPPSSTLRPIELARPILLTCRCLNRRRARCARSKSTRRNRRCPATRSISNSR